MKLLIRCLSAAIILSLVSLSSTHRETENDIGIRLAVKKDTAGTISVYYQDSLAAPILVHNAPADFRPYIHPLLAPDGKGVLTENSPDHHQHQTGIFWGITRMNGRDYFHNPQQDHWKRISSSILSEKGSRVEWQTVYALTGENGDTLLTETQNWALSVSNGKYYLDVEWNGYAHTDLTFGQYDYGGLFVRMPWKEGVEGRVINAARQSGLKAAAQPAMWIDVGLKVAGRQDLAHITLFDHPANRGYPEPWRVDKKMGVGTAKTKRGDWILQKGTSEVVRHQLVVRTGEFNNNDVNNDWSTFSGKTGTLATKDLWSLAKEEGRAARFLSPQEAIEAMTVLDGYKVTTWAAEPMLTQPMAFCWDDRGRLWVAENRDYESRRHGFSNSGDSRILILEDTDGDGIADKRSVFMEGIAFPAALAVGFDGVFVGAPPNLLFIPDRDKDDKADLDDIEVRLTGWGIRDRHETLNSLHWGPDGWLYGLQGFATPSTVGKPAGKGKLYKGKDPFPQKTEVLNGTEINGGVWRYHPVQDRFEVVAHGFSNPWGIDYDAKGQLFITACVIPHLWHVIPGGIYHRQGGRHFNPFHYTDIRTIADHSHRSAHGGARIYQSDAFPEEQRGRIFMANIHEHAVLSDILEPKGSGFTGRHGDDFLLANNAQWVGFSLEVGPEGALYVLDWHDADICGSEVLHRETGRIFRITPEKSLAQQWPDRYTDLGLLSDLELAGLQTSKSDWHSRRARILLQGRAVKRSIENDALLFLQSLFREATDPDLRLRAMWALHITGNLGTRTLLDVSYDKEEYIRSWAIQLLCEAGGNQPEVIDRLTKMAHSDSSAVVRRYLASCVQRLEHPHRWEILAGLLTHQADKTDHNIPKLLWFAWEPLVNDNPEKALGMMAGCTIESIVNYTARRITDAGKLEMLTGRFPEEPRLVKETLKGIRDALEGIPDQKLPAGWRLLYPGLVAQGDSVAIIAAAINQMFADQETAAGLLAMLSNGSSSLQDRRNAVARLAASRNNQLPALLPSLMDDAGLRVDAIRAVAAFDADSLALKLLEAYPSYNGAEKAEVIRTLSSRQAYGMILTKAIASKAIPKKDVPTYIARQLLRTVGSGFVEVWGPVENQTGTLEQDYANYRRLLTPESLGKADLKAGKELFTMTCSPCHQLFGQGGAIGPDITGANRSDLEYLLTNILEPNADIQDDYRMVVVTTRDGRTFTGTVTMENDRQLTLKIVGQDPVSISKSDIQSKEITPVSLMPPGLLSNLKDQEVLNLIAYLRQLEPAAHSPER